MKSRGAWLVGAILLLAAVLSGFGWWHQWGRGRQALEFWGDDEALAIRAGTTVTFAAIQSLEPSSGTPPDADRSIQVPGRDRAVGLGPPAAASDWRGLTHLRQALIEDASFIQWSIPATGDEAWDHLLEFRHERGAVVRVAIDSQAGWVCHVARQKIARLAPFMAQGLQQFLDEHRSDLWSTPNDL